MMNDAETKYAKIECASLEAFDALMNKYFPSGSPMAGGYPEYYGGAYINTDDGSLVINSIDGSIPSDDKEILSSCTYKVQTVAFSLNQLESAVDKISEKAMEMPYLCAWSVDDPSNCITIEMTDTSEASIKKFFADTGLENINNLYDFTVGEMADVSEETTGEAGSMGWLPNSGRTIGCRAQCIVNNQIGASTNFGFFTCGHGLESCVAGQTIIDVGTRTARSNVGFATFVTRAYYGNNPGGSATIKKADVSYWEQDTATYPAAIERKTAVALGEVDYHPQCSWIMWGMSVTMYGAASGIQQGRVTRRSYNYRVNDANGNPNQVIDFFRCNYASAHGDSGAMILRRFTKNIAGLHSGTHRHTNGVYSSKTCKMSNALDALNANSQTKIELY